MRVFLISQRWFISNKVMEWGIIFLMRPFNYKIHRIGRSYFWVAFLTCIIICGFLEVLVVTMPTDVKVSYIDYDSAGNAIETVKNAYPEWLRLFLIILVDVLELCYMIPLVAKRFHDVGYSTMYALVCIILIPCLIGLFLIFHVGIMPSDDNNKYGAQVT